MEKDVIDKINKILENAAIRARRLSKNKNLKMEMIYESDDDRYSLKTRASDSEDPGFYDTVNISTFMRDLKYGKSSKPVEDVKVV